ncbi:hypothetical protein A9Q99_03040 [Gammaproteobacteria bacterium 45_16_T64]|nr:hypothetical protein A9Q99_03040 [Gammaproteobacteria bacterium 45_16_T64]
MIDVIVLGGGAAGLMCALTAGQQGRRAVVLDHANKVGKKILMSGGGRCNFTNMYTTPDDYLSQNPHFCKSALSRYTPWDFIALVEKHNVAYHEKKLGQLFCDNKASDILDLLLLECEDAGVEVLTRCNVKGVERQEGSFVVESSLGTMKAESLVVATGGLSIPTMGATGFGYELAEQFGHSLLDTEAALVPFTLSKQQLQGYDGLSGISADVLVSCGSQSFRENLLFTHRGLSGPAILQISTYWKPGQAVTINWLPDIDALDYLQSMQVERPKTELKTLLSEFLSKRLAHRFCELYCESKSMQQYSPAVLESIAKSLSEFSILPAGTEGYRTAEVTIGGVDTNQVSSKTMESKLVPNLYFVGEVLDVTGHLGGFNFQWAWASGVAAGLVA